MAKFCHSLPIFLKLCVNSRENRNRFFANNSNEEINIDIVLNVGVIPWTKEISYCQRSLEVLRNSDIIEFLMIFWAP